MKHSLMWSVLAILAIACIGFFASASQGPPGFGPSDAQLMHTTFLQSAYVGALVSVATLFAGLALLNIAHQVLGGRLPRFALALLMFVNSLTARWANYMSASRRAFKGLTPESHYRNSRMCSSGV